MTARRPQAAPSLWIRLVFAAAVSLLALPAFGDDNAQANRLMVEAVGLIAAAERGPSAQERYRLLQRAHELLLDIVERHPSTELAVKLATGQRVGTVSLAGVREALDEARVAGDAAPPTTRRPPGAPVHVWRHRKAVLAVGWSAYGEQVYSVSRDGVAAARDIGTGATLHTWRYGAAATAAALSPDGRRMLAAGDGGAVTLSNTATGETVARWKHDQAPSIVALSPRGRRALVAVASVVMLGNTGTREVLHTWRHWAPVTAVALSPNGRRVLMGLADGEGVLADVETGATLAIWEHPGSGGDGLMSAAFSPDGRWVLAGAANRTAVLRDVRSGDTRHQWQTRSGVMSVAWSSSGRWVLTGDKAYWVELHEVETGRTLRKWRYKARVEALAFSADERRVLMGFGDGAVIVCDLRLPRSKRRPVRTSLTPDGGC